jgi:ribonuclease P protein component
MFKKTERLSRSEFSDYFNAGKKHYTPQVTIITHPLPSRKVAVVVGKKVAKSAVRRNALKRRVFAVLRSELTRTDYRGVVIVILKPACNSLPRSTMADIIQKAIAQVLKSA